MYHINRPGQQRIFDKNKNKKWWLLAGSMNKKI